MGIKAEYLDRAHHWEFSPQVRGLYKINDSNSLWSGYTQTNMLPSYFDTDTTFVDDYSYYRPNPELKNESVSTYEIGYRFTPSYKFQLDLTAFISDYSDVKYYLDTDEVINDYLYVMDVSNDYTANTMGIEIASYYQYNDSLEFYLGYSYLQLEAECSDNIPSYECWADYDLTVESQHIANLQTLWNINSQWKFDVITKYQNMTFSDVALYSRYDQSLRFDARLAWQYNPSLPMVEIIGQNIGGSSYSDSWILYKNEPQIRARISHEF